MTNTIPTTARTLTEHAKTEGLQVEVTHHPGVAYHLRISNTHGRLIGTGTWDLRGRTRFAGGRVYEHGPETEYYNRDLIQAFRDSPRTLTT